MAPKLNTRMYDIRVEAVFLLQMLSRTQEALDHLEREMQDVR